MRKVNVVYANNLEKEENMEEKVRPILNLVLIIVFVLKDGTNQGFGKVIYNE